MQAPAADGTIMADTKTFEFPTIGTRAAIDARFLQKVCDLGNSPSLNHSAVFLGLLHYSARGDARANDNDKNGVSEELLDALRSIGKAVITLFCADFCCDSRKYRSRGDSSHAADRFRQAIIPAVAKGIGLPDAIIYGEGVTVSEKSSASVMTGMLQQLIGAISLAHGLSFSRTILSNFVSLCSEAITTPLKDCKTLLQEYSQAHKMPLPEYQELETVGAAHSQIFRMRVATSDGRSAEGEGQSKKRAGHNAAENYLRQHCSSMLAPKSHPLISKSRAPCIVQKYPIKDPAFLHHIVQDFRLNPTDANDVALALIHRSYGLQATYDVGFGRDSGYLAVLGSAVQNWATQDLILRHYLEGLTKANRSPLASILADVTRDTAIAELFDLLNLDQGLLVGGGQRNDINLLIRSDTVQALIAILYRHKTPKCEFGEDVFRTRSGRLESWITKRIKNAIQQDRDTLLSPKTQLQERCQAIGLSVGYDSVAKTVAQRVEVLPRLHISRGERQLIHGQLPTMVKQSRREGEELLARTILDIFDNACGITSKGQLRLEKGQRVFAVFFLEQALAFASANADELIRSVRQHRMVKAGALGTQYLKVGDLTQFRKWVEQSETLLGNTLVTEVTLQFYRLAGQIICKQPSDLDVIKDFSNQAIAIVKRLDPMTYKEDIRQSELFETISNLAGIFKLKANSKRLTQVSQILDDVSFISKGQYRTLGIDATSAHLVSVSTRPGTLLALLSLVSRTLSRSSVEVFITDVSISLAGQRVKLSIQWPNDSPTQSTVRNALNESAMYQFVKKDLPFDEIETLGAGLAFLVFEGGFQEKVHHAAEIERAFTEGLPQPVEIYELLASWMHDMTNELVAFQTAINNANKTTIHPEKYRLVYMASKHIEKADEYLNSIRQVAGAKIVASISIIDVKSCLRDIVSDVLSWVPPTIAIVPPTNTDDVTLFSDPSILRGVLINLCKNAAEAIKGTGKITLEWVFDPKSERLEIEITDSAGALTEEACAQLNAGLPLASHKPTGSGVGLLAVIIMVRQLGGQLYFSSEPGKSTSVCVDIPSLSDALSDASDIQPATVSLELDSL